LNICLDAFFITKDIATITQILDEFLIRERTPRIYILRRISNCINLPESIYARLRKFNYKAENVRQNKGPIKDVSKTQITT